MIDGEYPGAVTPPVVGRAPGDVASAAERASSETGFSTPALPRASSSRLRLKRVLAMLGLGLALVVLLLPTPQGLTVEGQRAVVAFVAAVTLWVTNLLPPPVTGLLGMALVPLLGALPAEEAFALFGNRAVFFILGALMLSAGLQSTGLGDRLALGLLRRFDRTPRRLLAGIMVSSALLACIMPEHAVAALMFPLVLEIARALKLRPGGSDYGRALFLAMAWGTVAGGVTTYLGGSRNLLAAGLLEEGYGLSIGFLEWISYSWPIPTAVLLVGYPLLVRVFRPDVDDVARATARLETQVARLGAWTVQEKRLAVLGGLTLAAWIFGGQALDLAVTALLASVFLFALRIVNWRTVEEYVNWGVILMYGGAIVVASALTRTGVAEWAAIRFLGGLEVPPMLFILLVALMTMGLSELVSNVAAVATVLPLAYSWGGVLGLNPVLITLVTALAGGLAFMFPMGTPPNAIAYSSGYYSIADSVRGGVLLSLMALGIFLLVALTYWPLVGIQ